MAGTRARTSVGLARAQRSREDRVLNFLAHAYLALEREPDPDYVLGSMLPDFATMAGARLPVKLGERVRAGVDFHHEVDELFHGAPIFSSLMSSARAWLDPRGFPLGSAMAIAHVGVELLLDGELVRTRGVPQLYYAALQRGKELAESWSPEDPGPYREFFRRLAAAPVPEVYAEPVQVANTLVRILDRRPRLRIPEVHLDNLKEWAVQARPGVAHQWETLWHELSDALDPG